MRNLMKIPVFGAALLFTSCGVIDQLRQPIVNTGFNPLDKPWGNSMGRSSMVPTPKSAALAPQALIRPEDGGFNNGDIVEVVIPNTALFANIPKVDHRYQRVLSVGDTLKVVGGNKDFLKVVTENGESGYVSRVMAIPQRFLAQRDAVYPQMAGINNIGLAEPGLAPEPIAKGIGQVDTSHAVEPLPIPNIQVPHAVDIDPGLTVPDIENPTPTGRVEVTPEPLALAPRIPDPSPIVPSLPDGFVPEPSDPGL